MTQLLVAFLLFVFYGLLICAIDDSVRRETSKPMSSGTRARLRATPPTSQPYTPPLWAQPQSMIWKFPSPA